MHIIIMCFYINPLLINSLLTAKAEGLKLNEGDVILQGDFAENYKFKVQDEIQWLNAMNMLKPFQEQGVPINLSLYQILK